MSASDRPDAAAVEREVAGLERSVGLLLDELEALRERATRAEEAHGGLRRALKEVEHERVDAASVEDRLRELTDENERLRRLLAEGHARAERIRNRLIVMEDESR